MSELKGLALKIWQTESEEDCQKLADEIERTPPEPSLPMDFNPMAQPAPEPEKFGCEKRHASWLGGVDRKTCERCIYRIGWNCRRFPPTYVTGGGNQTYPIVVQGRKRDVYTDACAEHKEFK